MRPFLRKLGWLVGRRRKEDELREELDFHLTAETEEREAIGLSRVDAAYAAHRELGNVTLLREETRASWGWTNLEQIAQDLRYAVRTMTSNRAFTALAVLSLALGIGANTAIYSFVEAILLRSLPVRDPQSLVVMKWRAAKFPGVVHGFNASSGGTYGDGKGGTTASIFPYPALALFQSNDSVIASAFCYAGADSLTVTAGQQTESLQGQYVSADFFHGLEISPAAGRVLLPDDDRPGATPAVLLNYRYSQSHFGDAAHAIGQTVRINNVVVNVVGVAPPRFFGADPDSVPDLWLPIHAKIQLEPPSVTKTVAEAFLDRNFFWVEMVARLQPGVTPARAQAVLVPQFHQFTEASATQASERTGLPDLVLFEGASGLDSLRHRYSRPLFVLMAMSALILLIACANISNLLLARAMARRREIAVRLSMGAGRLRVVRQLLTESVLLASLGGAAGVAFAWWGIRFLTLLLGTGRTDFTLRAELNWHVMAVTFALSVLTGLLFGVAPAIQATRADVMPALKEMRAGASTGALRRSLPGIGLSQVLVGGQIAISLMLLVAAGLFGQTLANLQRIELGFNRENVLLFSVNPRTAGYDLAARKRFYSDLRERLSHLQGVRAVSLSVGPLLSGFGSYVRRVDVPGATPNQTGDAARIGIFSVGPDFFRTMQVPLLAGREFDDRDEAAAAPAIVNRRFAKLYGLENAVGRPFAIGAKTYQIVGVVSDALFLTLKEGLRPMIYFPAMVQSPGQATFELRAAGNPLDHANTVREIVRQMDSRLAVANVESQAARIDQAISQEITLARLCLAFAALALVIACVGLYGTVSFHVTRRTGEIGIRMALGAPRAGILWMVLRQVCMLGVAGLVIGMAGALAGSKYLTSFLYGIKPNDPWALAGAAAVLLAAALLAGLVPARRASKLHPMAALRHE